MACLIIRNNKQKTMKIHNAIKTLNRTLLLFVLSFQAISAPVNTEVELNPVDQAIDARNNGNLTTSTAILEKALTQSPNKLRIKLELAVNYQQIDKPQQAWNLVTQVLNEASLPINVRNNAEIFLKGINQQLQAKQKNSHSFTTSLALLAGHDSNANIAPDDVNLDVGTLPEEATSQGDAFSGLNLRLNHVYNKNRSYSQAPRPFSRYVQSGLSVYTKNYQDIDRSDLTIVSAHTGLLMIAQQAWSSRANILVDHIVLEGQSLANFYRFINSYRYHFPSSHLTLSASITDRDYLTDQDSGRKGQRYVGAIKYRITLPRAFNVELALEESKTDLSDRWRSYDSTRFSLDVHAPLSPGISLLLRGNYARNQYAGPEQYYDSIRSDRELRRSIALRFDQLIADTRLDVSYLETKRNSNNDIHRYDRRVIQASMTYSF